MDFVFQMVWEVLLADVHQVPRGEHAISVNLKYLKSPF